MGLFRLRGDITLVKRQTLYTVKGYLPRVTRAWHATARDLPYCSSTSTIAGTIARAKRRLQKSGPRATACHTSPVAPEKRRIASVRCLLGNQANGGCMTLISLMASRLVRPLGAGTAGQPRRAKEAENIGVFWVRGGANSGYVIPCALTIANFLKVFGHCPAFPSRFPCADQGRTGRISRLLRERYERD